MRSFLVAAPLFFAAGCSVFIEFDEDAYDGVGSTGGATSSGVGGETALGGSGAGASNGGGVSSGGGNTGGASGGSSSGGNGTGGDDAPTLEHYYPLDDSTGSLSAEDAGNPANRRVGTVSDGANGWGPGGVKGGAYTIETTADYLELPAEILDPNAFSISFFMASMNDSYRYFFATEDSSDPKKGLRLFQDQEQLRISQGTLILPDVMGALPRANVRWAYVTLTYEKFSNGFEDTLAVYVDGEEVYSDEESFDDTSPITDGILRFGRHPVLQGSSFVGRIDELRIYSGALSQSEVRALYESESESL